MKNLFKIPFLAIAISLSMAACKGHNSGSAADSAQDSLKSKVDSSSTMKTDSSVKVDTAKGSDTSKVKVDTVTKSVTKHTEVKKEAVKKN